MLILGACGLAVNSSVLTISAALAAGRKAIKAIACGSGRARRRSRSQRYPMAKLYEWWCASHDLGTQARFSREFTEA